MIIYPVLIQQFIDEGLLCIIKQAFGDLMWEGWYRIWHLLVAWKMRCEIYLNSEAIHCRVRPYERKLEDYFGVDLANTLAINFVVLNVCKAARNKCHRTKYAITTVHHRGTF
jgi:hypothetical protein